MLNWENSSDKSETTAFVYGMFWIFNEYLLNGSEVKWKLLSRVQLFVTPWTVVREILQARILEWIVFPFSRESSQPRDWTQVSHIADRFFISWSARKAQEYWSG